MNVSSSPHIRHKDTTGSMMMIVLLALLPATLFGIYNFGLRAALVIAVTVATCVGTEYIYERCMKLPITVKDYSAAVTGILLALNLPSTAPVWMCILGGIFAILVVKMLFGGVGQNVMNPALGARCFLLISFTKRMTDFTYDGISGPTPLVLLKEGGTLGNFTTFDMVVGRISGTIGETSLIAIVIGAMILILFGIIDLRIPASYIISFVVFLILFGGHGLDGTFLTAHLAGGGLMLGAFFMATDYVTSPITPTGKIVFGIFLGIMTGVFRIFGASAEGVSYAIILGNLLVPLIERVTLPKSFGKGGEKK